MRYTDTNFKHSSASMITGSIAALVLMTGIPVVHAQSAEPQIIVADDPLQSPDFGTIFSVDGDRMIAISSIALDAAGSLQSAADYFERDASGIWVKQQTLTLDEPVERFVSASLDGDRLLIGGKNGQLGSAFIFEYSGGQWVQVTELVSGNSMPDSSYGYRLALEGDIAVVSATAESRGGDPNDGSGGAVVRDGAVYVFTRRSDGVWGQHARLVDSNILDGSAFGNSVQIDGGVIVIGNRIEDSAGLNSSGGAYVYKRDNNGSWTPATLIPDAYTRGGGFGIQVAIDEGVALVSNMSDLVTAFEQDGSGNWVVRDTFKAIGNSIDIQDNNAIVVGSRGEQGVAERTGTVAFFSRSSDAMWHETGRQTVTALAADSSFGRMSVIDGNHAYVASQGAIYDFSADFSDGDNDQDMDRIDDETDNCPAVYNPDQTDLDFDGSGDVCDDDMDGDGQSNDEEIACMSDPLDAQSQCEEPSSAPDCNGVAATIYVDHNNQIVGGPNAGEVFIGELHGTAGDDVMVATDRSDLVNGHDGNDLICALSDHDEIYGGAGDDVIHAGSGHDYIRGEAGDDTIYGAAGWDLIFGDSGNDSMYGDTGIDLIIGGDGIDTGDGGAEFDICYSVTHRNSC